MTVVLFLHWMVLPSSPFHLVAQTGERLLLIACHLVVADGPLEGVPESPVKVIL